VAQGDVTKKELAAQSRKACLGSSDQKKQEQYLVQSAFWVN
jgi:hypothetical protein